MCENKRLCILYIAMSLDGYIAGTDDNLDFLSRDRFSACR